jgi:hypothetical protein
VVRDGMDDDDTVGVREKGLYDCTGGITGMDEDENGTSGSDCT